MPEPPVAKIVGRAAAAATQLKETVQPGALQAQEREPYGQDSL